MARGSATTPAGPSAITVTALVAKKVLAAPTQLLTSRARLLRVGALKEALHGHRHDFLRAAGEPPARWGAATGLRSRCGSRSGPDVGEAFKKTIGVVLTKKP